jgi:methylphosphotriester-DNA--protein-cysteine methyltransferase
LNEKPSRISITPQEQSIHVQPNQRRIGGVELQRTGAADQLHAATFKPDIPRTGRRVVQRPPLRNPDGARELLATSNSKVVEVALESGYKSLSMFNLMFTRRFGTSPGRWRQKNNLG